MAPVLNTVLWLDLGCFVDLHEMYNNVLIIYICSPLGVWCRPVSVCECMCCASKLKHSQKVEIWSKT